MSPYHGLNNNLKIKAKVLTRTRWEAGNEDLNMNMNIKDYEVNKAMHKGEQNMATLGDLKQCIKVC